MEIKEDELEKNFIIVGAEMGLTGDGGLERKMGIVFKLKEENICERR